MELRVHKLLVLLLALSCTPSTNCLDADDLLDYVKNQNARNSEYNSDGDRNSNGRNLNLTPARKRLNLTPTGSQGRPNLTPSGEKKRPNLTPSQGSSNAPCITKKGFPGECVSYYLCSEGGTIVEDGTDLLDVRADTCTHYLYVCCHIDQVQSDEDKEDDISDDILHFDAPNTTPHAPASPTESPQQSEYSPMSPGETVPTDKSFSSTLGHTRPPPGFRIHYTSDLI
ncbi:unnamed protein product [Leptosia nina]|uniref:PPAF-2-like Clip domain-containing protein n=1 Tax=Leptosia nina TaxID=320188 RepID=A0AAV1JW88_9NEOP